MLAVLDFLVSATGTSTLLPLFAWPLSRWYPICLTPPLCLLTDDHFTKLVVLWPLSSLLWRGQHSERVLTMLWPEAFSATPSGETNSLTHTVSASHDICRPESITWSEGLWIMGLELSWVAALYNGTSNQPISPINFRLFVGSSEWRGLCVSVLTQCSSSLCVLRGLKVV